MWGKKWMVISAMKGRGVRRLMVNAIKNFHFVFNPPTPGSNRVKWATSYEFFQKVVSRKSALYIFSNVLIWLHSYCQPVLDFGLMPRSPFIRYGKQFWNEPCSKYICVFRILLPMFYWNFKTAQILLESLNCPSLMGIIKVPKS